MALPLQNLTDACGNNARKAQQGEWLCDPGPYQHITKRMCSLDLGLRNPDRNHEEVAKPVARGNAKVTIAELLRDNSTRIIDVKDVSALREQLLTAKGSASERFGRVYIMEGLSPDYISELGYEFKIHPSFFADFQKNSTFTGEHDQSNDANRLPSFRFNINPEGFQVTYYEMRVAMDSVYRVKRRCAASGRRFNGTKSHYIYESKGGIVRPPPEDYMRTIIVRRKCSVWVTGGVASDWSIIVLTDPPMQLVSYDGKPLKHEPWQGGYRDILLGSIAQSPVTGPPRDCLRTDLCHYLCNNAGLIQDWSTPTPVTILVKKILIEHSQMVLNWDGGLIKHYEWLLSYRQVDLKYFVVDSLEEWWSHIHAYQRRCIEHLEALEDAMIQFDIPPHTTLDKINGWEDCNADFQFLRNRFEDLKSRAGLLVNCMTGLAGMMGNKQSLGQARRSLREAKSVKTLTLIGLIFIPSAWVAAVFSMNDNYAPGAGRFWVYFAVSIFLILLVFLLSFVFELGIDDNALWSLSKFREGVRNRRAGKKKKEVSILDEKGWLEVRAIGLSSPFQWPLDGRRSPSTTAGIPGDPFEP